MHGDDSLTLLTDLYQLTMAYGYWKTRTMDREAVFHLFFRKNPFGGGYAIAAGLAQAIAWLDAFRFTDDDRAFLATLRGNDDAPLFDPEFLAYLADLRLTVDLDAIPEGTAVFAHEPLIRVRGPLLQCQLLETALLNVINFQTLIATKAARVCDAARGDSVLEFGLRRAQGVDGALAASRAAYLGGCSSTSNVLAGRRFGIPVRGTHAHSWVMSFDDELEAFKAYASAMPNNCVFLVDTYDTLEGVRRAVQVAQWLKANGHTFICIRLDSGDLAELSIAARKILDEGGFPEATIVASNDLDEGLIQSLKHQGATISVWGVGTKLVTAYDQPALGGVYKLSAIREGDGPWRHKVKLSEQAIKISTPGIHQVRRFSRDGVLLGDMIWDVAAEAEPSHTAIDPMDGTKRVTYDPDVTHEDLLVPIYRGGQRVYEVPSLHTSRDRARAQLAALPPRTRRFEFPQIYPVGLERELHALRTALILQHREGKGA
jgi:nicotinate phosphoribosyltransferase